MNTGSFMMLFDDGASPMMEAVMQHGMATRFPRCRFETGKAPDPSFENSVIPMLTAADLEGVTEIMINDKPSELETDVQDAFRDLLREARAAQPS